MKKMRIHIDNSGKTTVKVEGAEGDECLDFTRAVEKALGTVEERVRHDDEQGDRVNVEEHRRVDTSE